MTAGARRGRGTRGGVIVRKAGRGRGTRGGVIARRADGQCAQPDLKP